MIAEIGEHVGVARELLVEPGTIFGVERGNRLLGRPGGITHGTNRTVGADRWGRFGTMDGFRRQAPLEIRI
jgi:hypothetical protein